ncbi:DMT family transporter [Candidatus Daviesbacteria bacterium]|nr:DMT family transporter [Candidatus Daviesbacteria bacterium]
MASKILTKPWPYLAILLTHIIWGANFVVAKLTLEQFPVMSLAFSRFVLAFILLIPFIILERKNFKIDLADLPKIILVGLTLITLNIALFYEGLLKTTVSDASVLVLIIPILSVLAGWWFLKEKVYVINLVGIFSGLLGAILIIGLPLFLLKAINNQALLGNILVVLASISWVAGAIISKGLLKKYTPFVVTTISFIVGMVTFALPALNDYLQDPTWISQITVLGILGLLYITILSSIFAYFLFEWGLKKTTVAQADLFTYIEPLIATTLGVIILAERVSFSFIIGSILIGLGAYWGTLGKAQHHHPHLKSHRT